MPSRNKFKVGDREVFQNPRPLVWTLSKKIYHLPSQPVWIKPEGEVEGVEEERFVFECVSSDQREAVLKIKTLYVLHTYLPM
jgi:hypothetical protein